MRREKVLVLGDDTRIFLTVARSLGRAGKEVHAVPLNWHSPALKSRYVAKIHRCPRYSDDPAGWCRTILDIAKTESFDLILQCGDPAILPLHFPRTELAGLPLAIHSAPIMDLLFDKQRTREL